MKLAVQLRHLFDNLRERLGDRERGAALVEYALLVALIAIVCIAAITALGGNAKEAFNNIASKVKP